MSRIITLLYVFLLIQINLFSQFNFVGTIRDSLSNETIPFAHVYFEEKAIVANEFGKFNFPKSTNQVHFSAIGYEGKTLELNSKDTVVFLNPRVYLLPEYIITPKETRLIEIGTKKRGWVGHSFFSQGQGYQVTKYISNDEKIEGTLKSISFYLTDKTKHSQKIRLLLNSRDSSEIKPKHSILPKSRIVDVGRKKGWITIDISDLRLPFPKEGFFTGIEFLSSKDKVDLKNILHFGLFPFEKEALTWIKFLGSTWNIPPFLDNPEVGQLNLMVKIKIEAVIE